MLFCIFHTGEKPHVCHICSEGFIRGFDLNKHLKIVHQIIPETNKPGVPKPVTTESIVQNPQEIPISMEVGDNVIINTPTTTERIVPNPPHTMLNPMAAENAIINTLQGVPDFTAASSVIQHVSQGMLNP